MLTEFAKNKQADAIVYDKARIHKGDPTAAGTANQMRANTAQENTYGKPAYADKAITLDAAVAGVRDSSVQPVFDIPAGETASHYTLWEGAKCVAFGALSAAETFAAHGKYTLTKVDVTNT